jgi:hypothetical protein
MKIFLKKVELFDEYMIVNVKFESTNLVWFIVSNK